jgi:alpha,alpha-trehalase
MRAQLGIGEETFLVGAIGAIKPQKDYARAVEVLAELARRRDCALAIVGGVLDASGLAEIDRLLGRAADAARFAALAGERQRRIESLLWDEARGLYFDYDLDARRRRPYPFATTFWPLWAGLASPSHARRVIANLGLFERPGGIMTSTVVSGAQWDAPFGWAPLQLFAVDGLRRAGDLPDADRIARAFLSMLSEDLERRGTLVEKYDVERRTSALGGALRFGYTSNEVGFGWTNGVALELLADLGR